MFSFLSEWLKPCFTSQITCRGNGCRNRLLKQVLIRYQRGCLRGRGIGRIPARPDPLLLGALTNRIVARPTGDSINSRFARLFPDLPSYQPAPAARCTQAIPHDCRIISANPEKTCVATDKCGTEGQERRVRPRDANRDPPVPIVGNQPEIPLVGAVGTVGWANDEPRWTKGRFGLRPSSWGFYPTFVTSSAKRR